MSPTPTSFLLPSLVGSLSKPSTALLPEDVDALPISSYPRLELMLLILFLICYVTFLLRQWRYLSKRAEGKIPYEMCRQYGSTTPSLRITPPAPRLKVKVPVLHIPHSRPKPPKMDLVTRIQQSSKNQNSSHLTVPTYLFNKDVHY